MSRLEEYLYPMEQERSFFSLRWSLAAGLLVAGLGAIRAAQSAEYDVIYYALTIPLAVLMILLTLPETLRFAATPVLVVIDSIVFPAVKAGRPPLDLRLGEFYGRKKRYAEAAVEYERVRGYYPRNRVLYQRLVDLYEGPLHQPEKSRRVRLRARLWLRRREYENLSTVQARAW